MKKQVRLTENDLKKAVKESVNILLNEMPTGKKIQFRDDKRDVWYKFASRVRNKNFGLCKSDQRQLGMMYAEAYDKDREDLAEKIYNYACKKQWEYGRMKSNGDEELCERLDMEMMDAFQQGEREYDNSDIWTDDDPNFYGTGGYEDSIYQFENKEHNSINNIIRLTESDIHKIIRETVNNVLNEVSGFDKGHVFSKPKERPITNPDDIKKKTRGWSKPRKREEGDWYESREYLSNVIKESINKVINEGLKGTDPNNVVPEDLASQYGFESEYADSANGLELWGKDIPNGNSNRLLFKLGIRNFTSISNTANGMHVRITVKPNQRINDRMQTPRKIGDYVNSNYGDDKGVIFNNPKNGHTRRLDKFGNFN